jgi:hypothetical protein
MKQPIKSTNNWANKFHVDFDIMKAYRDNGHEWDIRYNGKREKMEVYISHKFEWRGLNESFEQEVREMYFNHMFEKALGL